MDDITSLIQISEEDDSLLSSHFGGKQDLSSFDCSPLFQIPNPSPSLGSQPPVTFGLNEDYKSALADDGAEKENLVSSKDGDNKFKLDPYQMKKTKKDANLRKSLAWDKAFFTEEGILNPLELAILNGNVKNSAALPEICEEDEGVCESLCSPVSTMSNDMQEEKCLGGKTSHKTSITPNSRLPLKDKPSSSKKISPSSKAKRSILPSPDSKAAVKQASSTSLLPKPSAARAIKLPPKGTKVPPIAYKQESTRRMVSSGQLKKNDIVKQGQPKTVVTKSQQANSKPSNFGANAGPPKNASSKPSQPLTKTEAPSQSRIQSSKQEKCTKEMDSLLRPSVSVADSSGEQKEKNMKNESVKVAKPSGLRMPSPSLGFFGQSKAEDCETLSVTHRKPPLPKKMAAQSSKGSLMSSASVDALKSESVGPKEPKTDVLSRVKAMREALSDGTDVSAVEVMKPKGIKEFAAGRNNQKRQSEGEPLSVTSVMVTDNELYVASACEDPQATSTVSVGKEETDDAAHLIILDNHVQELLIPAVSEEANARTSKLEEHHHVDENESFLIPNNEGHSRIVEAGEECLEVGSLCEASKGDSCDVDASSENSLQETVAAAKSEQEVHSSESLGLIDRLQASSLVPRDETPNHDIQENTQVSVLERERVECPVEDVSSQPLLYETQILSSECDRVESSAGPENSWCEDLSEVIDDSEEKPSGDVFAKEKCNGSFDDFGRSTTEHEDQIVSVNNTAIEINNEDDVDVEMEDVIIQPQRRGERWDDDYERCDKHVSKDLDDVPDSCDIDLLISGMTSLYLAPKDSRENEKCSAPSGDVASHNDEGKLCGELVSFYMDLVSQNVDTNRGEILEENHGSEVMIFDPCEASNDSKSGDSETTSKVVDVSVYERYEEQIPYEGNSLNQETEVASQSDPVHLNEDEGVNSTTLTDVKKNAAVTPPSNAIPFSDEWLAAFEAAGEEVLTLKSGAVQNSPPDKAPSEPSPWSPVNRNQTLGPFDCTKFTNSGMPSSSADP